MRNRLADGRWERDGRREQDEWRERNGSESETIEKGSDHGGWADFMNTNNHDNEWEALVSAYIDGDLDPADRRRVESLAETDPAVRALIEQYRRLDELIRRGAGEVPPVAWDDFDAEFRGRRLAEERTRRLNRWLRRGTPLAAAAAIVVTFSLLYKPLTETAPQRITRPDAPARTVARVVIEMPPACEPIESYVAFSAEPATAGADRDVNRAQKPVILIALVGGGPKPALSPASPENES